MQICCSICKDLFIHHSEVVVTECGHLYHNPCVSEWFKNHNTCPKCRATVKKNKVHRIYFDVENDTDIDPSSLQYKIDKLLYDLQVKEGDIKKLSEKVGELEKYNVALRDRVREGEEEVQTYKEAIHTLKNQVRSYIKDAEVYNQMKKDYEIMKSKVATLEKVDRLIKGTVEEVTAMVSKTEVTPLSIRHLCTFVEALKQESKKIEMKKEKIAAELKSLSKELHQVRREKSLAEEQIEVLRRANSQLEEDLKYYKKLSEEQPKVGHTYDITSPSPKKAKILSSRMMVRPNENKLETSVIDITSPFQKFSSGKKSHFSLDKKIINNLEMKRNKATIDLDFDLEVVPGPSLKKTKPLSISNELSIFKSKLPVGKTAETNSSGRSNSNFVFDGMGGSKRINLAQRTPSEELQLAISNREALKKKMRKVSNPAPAVAPKGVMKLDHFFS